MPVGRGNLCPAGEELPAAGGDTARGPARAGCGFAMTVRMAAAAGPVRAGVVSAAAVGIRPETAKMPDFCGASPPRRSPRARDLPGKICRM